MARSGRLDFVEIVSENYMGQDGLCRAVLREVRKHLPVVPHGVGLSLGSRDPLDPGYLSELASLVEDLDPPWVSDHLCVSGDQGLAYHDLVPLPRSREAASHFAARIREARGRLGRELLVENPTAYMRSTPDEYDEGGFLREVAAQAGCRLLLDVNNLVVNAKNLGGDPFAAVEALAPGSVAQYHLAGHAWGGDRWIDTHGESVPEEVRELWRYALERIGPAWTLVERDQRVPPIEVLLDELDELRALASRPAVPGRAPARKATLPTGDRPAEASPASLAADPPRLVETLSLIHDAISGALPPGETAPRLGVHPDQVDLYRKFHLGHVRSVLEAGFPATRRLLAPDLWDRVVHGFPHRHPFRDRVLQRNGDAFPAYLAELASSSMLDIPEAAVDLAELEAAGYRAAVAPMETARVGASSGPRLNPTVQVLMPATPVLEHVRAFQAEARGEARSDDGDPPVCDAEGRAGLVSGSELWETDAPAGLAGSRLPVLVWRHPTSHRVRVREADPALLLAFKTAHDGLAPEDAADASGLPLGEIEAALARAGELGLVLTGAEPDSGAA